MRNRRYLLAACAVGLTACFALQTAEAGRLAGRRSLNTKPHGYQIVSDVVRAGRAAQRFEVRAGDCGADSGWSDCKNDRERSEFVPRQSWRYGTNQWIGFSVYLPKDFQTSKRVRTTVGQIHQRGGPTGKAGGLPSFPPMMQMEMQYDLYYLGVHILSGPASNVRDDVRKFPLARVSDMRGRWTDIIIHFDTSGGRERLEVFVDGSQKASLEKWITFRPREYYFKYGIYRSFVSRNGGPMPTQILYVDEVKMGRSRAGVTADTAHPVD